EEGLDGRFGGLRQHAPYLLGLGLPLRARRGSRGKSKSGGPPSRQAMKGPPRILVLDSGERRLEVGRSVFADGPKIELLLKHRQDVGRHELRRLRAEANAFDAQV